MRSGLSWPLLLRIRGAASPPGSRAVMTRCCFSWGAQGARGASGASAQGMHHDADAAPGLQQQQQQQQQKQQASKPAGAASKLPRTEAPLQRPPGLVPASSAAAAPPAPPLRVMTFNVLADGLAQHGDFVKCPPEYLAWEYRLPRIVQEVAEGRPEILALQEANHFDEIAAALAPLGLTGHFLPKKPAPPERYGAPPDGTALFYRPTRLAPLQGPRGAAYAAPGGGGGVMTQGYVTATLRDRSCGRVVVVAATHLKAKGGAANEEARRLQALQLLAHASAAAEAAAAAEAGEAAGGGAAPRPVGVLVLGDLNDSPGSPACAALQGDAALPLASLWDVPWAARGGGGQQQQPQQQQQQQQQQRQGGGGGGAEGGEDGNGGEEEFTTWKFRSGGEARRVIDHVFFSPGALAPAARWRMPSACEIGPGGLPCARYPSDHVAVAAAFEWVP